MSGAKLSAGTARRLLSRPRGVHKGHATQLLALPTHSDQSIRRLLSDGETGARSTNVCTLWSLLLFKDWSGFAACRATWFSSHARAYLRTRNDHRTRLQRISSRRRFGSEGARTLGHNDSSIVNLRMLSCRRVGLAPPFNEGVNLAMISDRRA